MNPGPGILQAMWHTYHALSLSISAAMHLNFVVVEIGYVYIAKVGLGNSVASVGLKFINILPLLPKCIFYF